MASGPMGASCFMNPHRNGCDLDYNRLNPNIGGDRMRPAFWLSVAVLCVCLSPLTGDELGTGWWRWQPVTYKLVHGLAVVQGDVQLGTPDELASPWAGTL